MILTNEGVLYSRKDIVALCTILRTELGYCIHCRCMRGNWSLRDRNLSEEDRANMQNVPVHPVLELSKYLPLVDHVVSMHGAQRATEVTTMQQ